MDNSVLSLVNPTLCKFNGLGTLLFQKILLMHLVFLGLYLILSTTQARQFGHTYKFHLNDHAVSGYGRGSKLNGSFVPAPMMTQPIMPVI